MKKLFYLVFFAALVIFTFSITSCKDLFDSYELTADVENSESGENTPIVDPSTGGSSGGESGDSGESASENPAETPTYKLYVSGSGGILETAGSDSTGTGEESAPYASLEKAISHINNLNENVNWTVIIDGLVSGDTVIDELKASSVTIKGMRSSSKDKLSASESSVIAVTTNATILIDELTVTGGKGYHDSDTGDIYGGGIYIEKGTVTISNSSIKDNGTSGVIYGGGIYVATSALLNISGCNITSNGSENAMGGGIYNEGKVNIFGNDGNYIKDNNAGDGGGIYNASVKAKLTLEGFFEISANTTKDSSGKGGGIFNAGIFEMSEDVSEDSSISGNTAAYGGGVYTRKKFTMAAGNIQANFEATKGGGVYNENGGEFIMTGGYIDLNTAVDGGGVYNEGLMKMYGTASIGNEYSWDGEGNAYVNGCCNSVSSKGGGIYNSSTGNLTLGLENITDSQDFGIYFNYAAVTGGGIFTEGECNIYGGVINYNGALTSGVDGVAGTITNASNLPSDVYIQDITNL